MEEEIRINNRQKTVKRWLEGGKEDIAVVEQTAWSFLPKANDVVITDGQMVYMN